MADNKKQDDPQVQAIRSLTSAVEKLQQAMEHLTKILANIEKTFKVKGEGQGESS